MISRKYLFFDFIENKKRIISNVLIVFCLLFLVSTGLVYGQSRQLDVCNIRYLGTILSFVIQLTLYGSVIGGGATYLIGTAADSIPSINQQQRKKIKEVKGKAIASIFKIFLAAGAISLLISWLGIGGECFSFTPI